MVPSMKACGATEMWLIADGREPRAISKEGYECWLEFLRYLVSRGLRPPVAVTSDGAPGLIKAIEAVFPKSIRIRCWYHRMSNFRGKVPQEMWPEIKAELETIRDAANYKQEVRRRGGEAK